MAIALFVAVLPDHGRSIKAILDRLMPVRLLEGFIELLLRSRRDRLIHGGFSSPVDFVWTCQVA